MCRRPASTAETTASWRGNVALACPRGAPRTSRCTAPTSATVTTSRPSTSSPTGSPSPTVAGARSRPRPVASSPSTRLRHNYTVIPVARHGKIDQLVDENLNHALRSAPAIAPPSVRRRPGSDLLRLLPYLLPYRARGG